MQDINFEVYSHISGFVQMPDVNFFGLTNKYYSNSFSPAGQTLYPLATFGKESYIDKPKLFQ